MACMRCCCCPIVPSTSAPSPAAGVALRPPPHGLGPTAGLLRKRSGVHARAAAAGDASNDGVMSVTSSQSKIEVADSENFCIIENSETVKDFANLQLDEISSNIASRRNKIFLLMEEVRRLRIQQRLKGGEVSKEAELMQETYVSALPFLPPLSVKTLNTYYYFYAAFCLGIISFGALLAPILEVKLGLGGTSYLDFVESMHLPRQLAQVDPIVASFCGGAVGVVSALLVIEINNIKQQQNNRCFYCEGTGYLLCGHCVGSGLDPSTREPCTYCAGTTKVMCTSCLCTGKQLATEHDPRIDPF